MNRTILGGLHAVVTGGTDGQGGGDGPVVVLLHGFGAPGDDLVPLTRFLAVPRAVRFVFPAAPLLSAAGLRAGDRLRTRLAGGEVRSEVVREEAP